ncbi:TATA box-binding protein-associated factor RNA polymerase I subunit B [Caerostris extrusa]|uniref:TATA box-binding protein-associated factor RNA polymerase I subunit B n=1 Tax=Caerostris extrusa TaxID=172846 RepID=A0AAV4NI93_CAEEX|nr:TATA box-binding protein-associated factor RNA polymerase I subunit B [Caerostris extrusa]
MPVVIRFVMDLNLPSCIIPIVKNINDMLKEEENQWYEIERKSKRCIKPIPMYEAQAMASIIVALKLLFVLDDEYEKQHSEIMMKINILLKSDKLFVWNEWKQQISLKDFLFMKSGASCSDLSNLDKLSSEFIAKYSSLQPSPVNHNQSNAAKAKKEIQNQLKHLLNFNISESLEVTSFPIKSQQASMISNWKKWHIFKDTKEIDFTFLSKDFSSRLFFYDYEESDQSTEELINILLSSLYESVELRTWCNLALTRENILRTTSKYWFKNFPPRKFSVSGWIEELPDSFTWLLKFLIVATTLNGYRHMIQYGPIDFTSV